MRHQGYEHAGGVSVRLKRLGAPRVQCLEAAVRLQAPRAACPRAALRALLERTLARSKARSWRRNSPMFGVSEALGVLVTDGLATRLGARRRARRVTGRFARG